MSETLNDKTIKELVRLGQSVGEFRVPGGATVPYAVIPSDCKIEDLTRFLHNQYRDHPHRKIGTSKVLDAASFCEYYTLFSDVNSRVFADETTVTILAVLDYHAALEGGPRWGQHRIDLKLRPSEEWITWKGADGKKFTQMEFAEFIEDNQPDVTSPDGATMLEVARDLQAKSGADFSSAFSQANGSVRFEYTETVKGSYGNGRVDVPERFIISIPIYIGSDPVSLTARLRYRLNSGKLQFWFDLLRASTAERNGFLAVRSLIADTLGIKIINGQPA